MKDLIESDKSSEKIIQSLTERTEIQLEPWDAIEDGSGMIANVKMS